MSDSEHKKTPLAAGTVCGGNLHSYEVGSELGSGGMGTVYRAKIVGGDREVALKVLHAEFSEEGSSSRERFEREIHVLTDLKAFRGIVRIEDWGSTDAGGLFLVMELVDAPTLADILDENPKGLNQLEAIQIIVEVLSVLEPIHRRRFLHRDLKPHNISVYRDPLSVRILDFGLSKPYQEGVGYDKVTRKVGAKAQEIPGSPHYMAVEQFLRPKDVDARTDLYAIGIILYEMLAGVPPFRGVYLQDILKQHRETEPQAIATTADGKTLSYRISAVLEKALAKKREARYQDASEFKDALFDVLNALNRAERPLKVLDDEYSILDKLGAGGNSDVFEAENKATGDRVAMKVAREGGGDWDRETLLNEADRALKHPNIVPIVEFGSLEGRPALVMQLMSAGTVEDYIQKYADDGFPEDLFYRVIVDVCRGLHHAHVSNIVHRDVKPANMLVSDEGTVKMCDFGIAKRFEQAGQEIQGSKNTMMAKGTAQYMPPEQCDLQGRADKRSDVYSLGCVIYEMLAGQLPFSEGILLMQHMQSDPPPLLVKGDFRNPDELCRLVERCMKKRKDDRFQSMKELAQELVRIKKLSPQKRAHKAVTLATKPDDDETQLVEQMGGRPLSRQGRLLAFGVPTLMILVVVFGFTQGWFDTGQTAPLVEKTSDQQRIEQASRQMKASAEEMLTAGDHEGLMELNLAELIPQHQSGLAEDIRLVALQELRARPQQKSDASLFNSTALSWISAYRLYAGDDEALVASLQFSTTVEAWGELPGAATPEGSIPYADAWWTTFGRALQSTRNELRAADIADWKAWRQKQQIEVWRSNRDRVLRLLQSAAKERQQSLPGGFSGELQGVVSRDPAREGHRDLFTAAQLWVEATARSSSTPVKFVTFVLHTAPLIMNEALDLSALSKELKTRRDGRPAPSNLRDSLLNALNNFDDGPHLASLVAVSVVGDPRQWAESISKLEEVGIRRDLFGFSLVRGLMSALDSSALTQLLGEDLDQKKRILESMDQAVKETVAVFGVSAQSLSRAWNTASAAHRVSDQALGRQQVLASLGSLTVKDSLDDIVAAWQRCDRFVQDNQVDSAPLNRIKHELARSLLVAQRPFTLLLLRDHLRGTTLVAEAERAIAKSLSIESLLDAEYRSGLPLATRFNAVWRSTEVPCIQLIYPMGKADLALFADGGALRFRVNGGRVQLDAVQQKLKVQLSPRDFLKVGQGASKTAGEVQFRIELLSELNPRGVLLGLDMAYPGPLASDADYEAPSLKSVEISPDGSSVTVTVTDNSPLIQEGLSDVRFAGRLASGLSPQIILDKQTAQFVFAVTLESMTHLADGRDEPLVAGSLTDAFGNTSALSSLQRTPALLRRLTSALLQVCDKDRETWNKAPRTVSDFTIMIKVATQALLDVQSHLLTYREFNRRDARNIADRILRDVVGGFGQALTPGVLPKSDWDLHKPPFDALVNSVIAFEQRLGSGSVAAGPTLSAVFASSLLKISKPTPDPVAITVDWILNDIDLDGLNFLLLRSKDGTPVLFDGNPAWMMATELSVGHMSGLGSAGETINRIVRSAGKRKDQKWRDPAPEMPLTPLALRRVQSVVDLHQRNRIKAARVACGGPVSFAVPTLEMWRVAAKMQREHQAGGRGKYPFGDWSRTYTYSGVDSKDGHPPFSALNTVGSDNSKLFHFLGGNVSEWVRVGRGLQPWGGSYSDRSSRFAIDTQEPSTPDRAGIRLILTR